MGIEIGARSHSVDGNSARPELGKHFIYDWSFFKCRQGFRADSRNRVPPTESLVPQQQVILYWKLSSHKLTRTSVAKSTFQDGKTTALSIRLGIDNIMLLHVINLTFFFSVDKLGFISHLTGPKISNSESPFYPLSHTADVKRYCQVADTGLAPFLLALTGSSL